MKTPQASHSVRGWAVMVTIAGLLSAMALAASGGGAHAKTASPTPDALASDAYGASAFATLLGGGPIALGPLPAARLYQPGEGSPQNQTLLSIGPVPSLGPALIQYVGALYENASGSLSGGTASAISKTAHVCLLNANPVNILLGQGNCNPLLLFPPLVSATAVKAKVAVTCSSVHAATKFVGLGVNGQGLPVTLPANTTISIPGVATVVLNEQFPDASGRGFTVNAIHVYLDQGALNLLLTGDIVVGHAHASVDCGPNTKPIKPTAGGNVGVSISKTSSISGLPSVGQQFTYTVNVSNTSTTQSALLQRVTDELPVGLAPVSATGDLEAAGFTFAASGSSATWTNPAGDNLAPGATVNETLTVQSVSANSVLCNEATALALPPAGSPATGQSADYDSGLVGCIPTTSPCSAASGAVTTGTMALYTTTTSQSGPEEIACNPADGNLYFTEASAGKIGKITPAGVVTEYVVPARNTGTAPVPEGITAGPDGKVWFTEENSDTIGVITPSGKITEYRVPTPGSVANVAPEGITVGPDGNLWFTERAGQNNTGGIGTITPSGSITQYNVDAFGPDGIVSGPGSNLWFTNNDGNRIGKITTSGAETSYQLPAFSGGTRRPEGIAVGSDGNVWFAEEAAGNLGQITPSGGISEFALSATSSPNNVVTGPDGALFITGGDSSSSILRAATSGAVTNQYTISVAGSGPEGIASGPGGLWFVGESTAAGEGLGNTVGQLKFS